MRIISGFRRRFLGPGSLPAFAAVIVIAATVMFIVIRTIARGMEVASPDPWHMMDFDDTYIVGLMALKGTAAHAYDITHLQAAMAAETGRKLFLPWGYPPPYDLMASVLALLSPPVAYAGYTAGTLLAYLGVMRAVAGRHFAPAVLVVAPMLLVNAIAGQTGYLMGALAGLAALGWLARQDRKGGAALGLMVLKPHLALGLGMMALASGRWRMLAVATAVTAALAAAATLVFGVAIWPAFLGGVQAASENLAQGHYAMWRMVSVYASLRTVFRLSAGPALAGQIVAAATALTLVGWAVRRLPVAEAAGFALIASLAVSPYVYDYDLVIAGPAAALLIPAVRARTGALLQGLLVLAAWSCVLFGQFLTPAATTGGVEGAPPDGLRVDSFGGPVLWLVLIALVAILQRPERTPQGSSAALVAAE